MSIALYMDEHVHRAITAGLRLRGTDVLTVQEDERTGVSDSLILDRASELQRIIFSQDADFLTEAAKRQSEGRNFSGVIYAHQLLVSIGNCVKDLDLIAKAANLEDFANCVYYLPL